MFKMKPHAMNAAKKAGLDPLEEGVVFKGDDGLWHVRSDVPPPLPADPMVPVTAEPGFVPAGVELAQQAADALAQRIDNEIADAGRITGTLPVEGVVTARLATGAPAFPDRKAPIPANPVAFIRHILSTVPFPDRKSAVAFFVGQGINEGTAKTQYQRWRSESK